MGMIAEAAKRVNAQHQGFEPKNLDERTVGAIFNRCVASSGTVNPLGTFLFTRGGGYKETSNPVYFDRKQLEHEKLNILYLLGQLQQIHDRIIGVTPVSVSKKYDGEIWSKNNHILLELLHLGNALNLISPFSSIDKQASIAIALIKPTLSPKDPNFPAWWEAHKAEWE